MKCPHCDREMILIRREAERTVWACRNSRCPEHEKEQAEEETANESEQL